MILSCFKIINIKIYFKVKMILSCFKIINIKIYFKVKMILCILFYEIGRRSKYE